MFTKPVSVQALQISRIFADPALSGSTPRALKVSPDGKRVTFLRGKSTAQDRLDLWEYVVATGKTQLLVDADSILGAGSEQLSSEEQARRERQRTASLSGIVDYFWSEDGKQLLFPLAGALYVYDLAAPRTRAVRRLTDPAKGPVLDAKFSPQSRYVSYVRGANLYVTELATLKETALTSEGGGTVAYATAEFVAQEEMARFTGYWWAPDEQHIAVQRYDEAPVPIARRFEIYADRTEVVEQRYPAAGQPNVLVSLSVVALKDPNAPIQLDLGADPDIYLARVVWLPDAKRVSVQRQSRDQRTLDLLLFTLRGGAPSTLLSERSESFVNLHEQLHFLKNQPAFIWSSERSGYAHLALYDLKGNKLRDLSSGQWVVERIAAVDEARGLVYVVGNREDVNQRQLYVIALDGRTAPKLISEGAGNHDVVFARDASVYVDTYSDPSTPPQVRLHSPTGKTLAVLEANNVAAEHPYFPYLAQHLKPEYGTLEHAGTTLHYRVIRPANFDPAKSYPALVYTYGGPHAQVLQKQWDARWGLLLQHFAQSGYVVFSLDNRGSARRGKAFESAIFRNMGGPDVADQLAGIRALAKMPGVDAQRIGVFGWSYGGYMALQMLAQGGDLLRAGAAGAPVTDWSLYDTHYTERYMDLPTANVAGYRNSTVFAHLDGLKARLMLVHGMADDNVLFTHSTQLMSALQKRGIAFDLMTYPGMKHGAADAATRTHVYQGIAEFFARELAPQAPTKAEPTN